MKKKNPHKNANMAKINGAKKTIYLKINTSMYYYINNIASYETKCCNMYQYYMCKLVFSRKKTLEVGKRDRCDSKYGKKMENL